MSREFRVAEWLAEPELNQISKNGRTISVEPKVIEVLAFMASRPGEVLSREQIHKAIWPDTFVSDDVLTYSISELRRAFGDDAKNPSIIQTIPRRGYRLIAPVKWPEPQPEPKEVAAEPVPAPDAIPSGKKHSRLPSMWLMALAGVTVVGALVFFARSRLWPPSVPPEGTVVLAVLPFQNLGGNPDQDYFSDGLTEEMSTQLGRLQPERLRVIARTSSVQYKNTRKRIDQIGRELGANYILEGSVRREGERIRISTQLIRVSDQTQLWSESFDRELSGILSVQNEVAIAVARRIRISLSDAARSRLSRSLPLVPEAHEAYLRGRLFWNRRTPGDLQRAVEYFEQAIRQDPGYPPPYAGLADSYILLMEYADAPPDESSRRAKQAASKALELDPGLAEAHASLGMLQYCHDWNWAESEKSFQQAIGLNPSYTTAHHWYANLLSSMGRLDEARAEIQRAAELDALSPIAWTALAWRVHAAGRQFDQALRAINSALAIEPDYGFAHRRRGAIYIISGRREDAVAETMLGVKMPDPSLIELGDLGYVYGAAGRPADAVKILEDLLRRAQTRYVDATRIALIYAGLGDKERALDWLERGFKQRAMGLVVIKMDPRFDALHPHPRYQNLLRDLKLAN